MSCEWHGLSSAEGFKRDKFPLKNRLLVGCKIHKFIMQPSHFWLTKSNTKLTQILSSIWEQTSLLFPVWKVTKQDRVSTNSTKVFWQSFLSLDIDRICQNLPPSVHQGSLQLLESLCQFKTKVLNRHNDCHLGYYLDCFEKVESTQSWKSELSRGLASWRSRTSGLKGL